MCPDVYVHYACFVNNTGGMRWTVSSTSVLFDNTGSVEDVLNIDDTYFILLTDTTGGFTATLSFVSANDQDGMTITCQDLNDLTTATTQLSIKSKCVHILVREKGVSNSLIHDLYRLPNIVAAQSNIT